MMLPAFLVSLAGIGIQLSNGIQIRAIALR